jgi:hypothetical protein
MIGLTCRLDQSAAGPSLAAPDAFARSHRPAIAPVLEARDAYFLFLRS